MSILSKVFILLLLCSSALADGIDNSSKVGDNGGWHGNVHQKK